MLWVNIWLGSNEAIGDIQGRKYWYMNDHVGLIRAVTVTDKGMKRRLSGLWEAVWEGFCYGL